MITHRTLGVAAVIAAAVLWGTTGTVQTLLPPLREPLAVGALRLIFGALALLVLALCDPASRRAWSRLPWRGVLFAGVSIGLYNLFFFWAVTKAGVGPGTAVAIGSAPIWATLYEVAVAGRRPGPVRLAGQAVSVLGVAILSLSGGGPAGSILGVGLALLAGASYASYSLATSAIGHRAPSTAIAAATFAVAAVFTAPILFMVPTSWIVGPMAWGALAFLGVAATGLSYALYTWGLTRVAASTAVTLALAEPVTAWLLATFAVGEPVTLQSALGVALILGGLAVVTGRSDRGR